MCRTPRAVTMQIVLQGGQHFANTLTPCMATSSICVRAVLYMRLLWFTPGPSDCLHCTSCPVRGLGCVCELGDRLGQEDRRQDTKSRVEYRHGGQCTPVGCHIVVGGASRVELVWLHKAFLALPLLCSTSLQLSAYWIFWHTYSELAHVQTFCLCRRQHFLESWRP